MNNHYIEMPLLKDYNCKSKKGFICYIDKIEYDDHFQNRFKMRVINRIRKPEWFDIGWFIRF